VVSAIIFSEALRPLPALLGDIEKRCPYKGTDNINLSGGTMTHQIEDGTVKKFLKEIMDIERIYEKELKNAKSARQSELKELLDKFASKELDDENS